MLDRRHFKKLIGNTSILLIILVVSLFFSLAIGLDLSPYLRGPAPYPPDLGVLLHRIITPGVSGYFTASLSIKNIAFFLTHYQQSVGSCLLMIVFPLVFSMYAIIFYRRNKGKK